MSRPLPAEVRKDLVAIQEIIERVLKLEKLLPTQILEAVADAFQVSGKPSLALQLNELRGKWLFIRSPTDPEVH